MTYPTTPEQPQTEAERLAQWLVRCAESIEQINAADMLRALAAELAQARAEQSTSGYAKKIEALIAERDTLRAELEGLKAQWQWLPVETAPTSDTLGPNRYRLMLWVKGYGLAFGHAYAIPGEPPYFSVEQHTGDVCVTAWRLPPDPPTGEVQS
jgi:hypothetical protein